MVICNCVLHLELPHVHSLKGRRSITNSLKEKLKSFNVSVLDLSGAYPKEADIAFVFLAPDSLAAAQYREKVDRLMQRHFPELLYDLEHELF